MWQATPRLAEPNAPRALPSTPMAEVATAEGRRKARARSGRCVAGLEIEAFRGIPRHLHLTFDAPGAGPPAVVILGDNGSGKSSIIDALQFGLQYQLPGVRGRATAAAARSGLTSELPTVAVRLSDGAVQERHVERDENERLRASGSIPSDFSRTPLVLRRADILRFWDTPAELRQTMFIHFFRPGQRPVELPQERTARIKAQLLRAKARRDKSRTELARLLELSPAEIPTQAETFNNFVSTRLYGWDRGTRRRRVRRLPPDVYAATIEMREALKEIRKNKKESDRPAHTVTDTSGELTDVLREAGADVTTAFRAISPTTAVSAITFGLGEEASMAFDVRAELANGTIADPARVLSEANRDLVAFLIFVAIAKAAAARGQAKVIVLDDVFQSVDGPIRVAALDHVAAELRGWQFILTAHDRLWREQLLTVMRRHNHPVASFEIAGWDPEHGPDVRATTGDLGRATRKALETGDAAAIAVHAGRLVELLAHELSWTLPISVTRRQDDRYTLGDLWPSVYSKLKKTNAAEPAAEVERYLHLRNILGAHVNPWAQSTSLAEASRFGESALALLAEVRCAECARWVEPSPEKATYVCRCGATRVARVEDGAQT
jgi:hypothetical protein